MVVMIGFFMHKCKTNDLWQIGNSPQRRRKRKVLPLKTIHYLYALCVSEVSTFFYQLKGYQVESLKN